MPALIEKKKKKKKDKGQVWNRNKEQKNDAVVIRTRFHFQKFDTHISRIWTRVESAHIRHSTPPGAKNRKKTHQSSEETTNTLVISHQ